MIEWWNGLSNLGQIFGAMAIPATIIMIFQTVLLFIGGFGGENADSGGGVDLDDDADFDVSDHDGDLSDGPDGDPNGDAGGGLRLVSVRGIVAFFSVGGWTGLVLSRTDTSPWIIAACAFFAGLLALYGIALLFKYSLKLQDKGNLDVRNAVGKEAEVYIPIPANYRGFGKINILIQERLVELEAVTNSESEIKTGETVVVVSVVNAQRVAVERSGGAQNKKPKGGISKWA